MFRSNVSSKFLYFVGIVFDENTWKVSTRVNGRQYPRWMSISECVKYLLQFFTGRCQSYSLSVKLHLAVCTSFEALCLACLYMSLKIVNFMFLHFLSA